MPECSKCDRPVQSGSLCDMCRVERNHAGAEPEWDAEPRCGVCHDPAPEGDYAGDRAGIWMCSPCQTLGLTPRERDQLVAATPATLGGLIEWTVGADGAYPERDPGREGGFETASTRLVADGSGQSCIHCGDPIDRGRDDPPLRFEGDALHWDCLEDALEAADDAEWGVEQQGLGDEAAQGQATIDGGIAKSGGDR